MYFFFVPSPNVFTFGVLFSSRVLMRSEWQSAMRTLTSTVCLSFYFITKATARLRKGCTFCGVCLMKILVGIAKELLQLRWWRCVCDVFYRPIYSNSLLILTFCKMLKMLLHQQFTNNCSISNSNVCGDFYLQMNVDFEKWQDDYSQKYNKWTPFMWRFLLGAVQRIVCLLFYVASTKKKKKN